jgi:hypothetical protein
MVFIFYLILKYKPKKCWAKILFNSNIIVKERKKKNTFQIRRNVRSIISENNIKLSCLCYLYDFYNLSMTYTVQTSTTVPLKRSWNKNQTSVITTRSGSQCYLPMQITMPVTDMCRYMHNWSLNDPTVQISAIRT